MKQFTLMISALFLASLTGTMAAMTSKDPITTNNSAHHNPGDGIDWNAHKWQAPSATDSRGPCPGLNT